MRCQKESLWNLNRRKVAITAMKLQAVRAAKIIISNPERLYLWCLELSESYNKRKNSWILVMVLLMQSLSVCAFFICSIFANNHRLVLQFMYIWYDLIWIYELYCWVVGCHACGRLEGLKFIPMTWRWKQRYSDTGGIELSKIPWWIKYNKYGNSN